MTTTTKTLYDTIIRSRKLLEAYPTMIPKSKKEAEEWVKQWREMGSEYVGWTEVPYDSWFEGKERVYLPIDEVEVTDTVEPPEELDDVLKKYEFEVLDLEKGLARSLDPKNAKNTYGIGKILARYTKDVQKTEDQNEIDKAKNLVNDFAKYMADIRQQQTAKTKILDKDHLIAISRDPMDIMMMSTDRAWTSCQTLDPKHPYYSYHVPAHILRAGLIAYKIRKDDLEIKDPDARLLIIPYQKQGGGMYLAPALYIYARGYGHNDKQFKGIVQRWLDSKQGPLGETAKAPYLQMTSNEKNPNLNLYGDCNPTVLAPNDPRSPEVLKTTLHSGGGAAIVADWLAQGKIRPTTELLLKKDRDEIVVADALAATGKGIRSVQLLKLEYTSRGGYQTSLLGAVLPYARETDFVRYVEKAVVDQTMLDLPTGTKGSSVAFEMSKSAFFPNLPDPLMRKFGEIAEQKYPSIFSSMVSRGYVLPPDISWYSKTDSRGDANIFALLAVTDPPHFGAIPIEVFSSRMLKTENHEGQSCAYLVLQYMLKHRVKIQHIPSVKAIKAAVTASVPVMSMMTKTDNGEEPLVCWWALNRKVFWTDDPHLLPLRSTPQGGKTLAHILAENHERNKWIPADRKVLNWVYENEGRGISVRDILVSKGVTQGLGNVDQPRKRVGGVQGADELGERRNRYKRQDNRLASFRHSSLVEYHQLLGYEDEVSREHTLELMNKPKIRDLLVRATNHRFDLLEVDEDGYVNFPFLIDFSDQGLTKIPIPFGHIGGNFYCHFNRLQSLEGAPKSVGGHFSCSQNQLQSLEGAPKSVGGVFTCSRNQLKSLEGAPESVGGDFHCYLNQLQSLEGAPKFVSGDFYCADNPDLPREEIERYRKSGAVEGVINYA